MISGSSRKRLHARNGGLDIAAIRAEKFGGKFMKYCELRID